MLVVGMEIEVRARAIYDSKGLKVSFEGILTAVNESTVDANIKFNGTTLMVSNIPIEMIAAPQDGE